MAAATAAFSGAKLKLKIASVDDQSLQVSAQYNPKELQIDKDIPWQDHNERGVASQGEAKKPDVEFNGATKRSLTLELLFDCYETRDGSVERSVEVLEQLTSVTDPESSEDKLRRPHHCVVTWGAAGLGRQRFLCVIQALSTKYTMWDERGIPVRAICTVKLKEARIPKAPARAGAGR